MNIAFFGSSLLSAYWNGAATYYRGVIRNLHQLGHRVVFYEPDAYDRQKHRDIEEPEWARVHVYQTDTTDEVLRFLDVAKRKADCIVKTSGIGVFDELLEREISLLGGEGRMVAFWDVDAPATLDRLDTVPGDPFADCVPRFDLVFTYGGGEPVCNAYRRHGARECVPIYNGLDPLTHHPVPPDPRFQADLSFLGNRLPDREARVDEFFFRAAELAPGSQFLLGGNGWHDKPKGSNVSYIGHVYTADHNAFNCTPRAVVNISRESMARYGFSPATRVFEAAGAAACLITDDWEGIDQFFEPGREILVARDGAEVAAHIRRLSPEKAHDIGQAALARVLSEHTYAHRARQVDAVLTGHHSKLAGSLA